MKMKKKALLITTASAVVILSGVVFTTSIYAQGPNQPSTFVSALASKLGLPESKVESALEQTRNEVHTQRMTEALQNGDLTQRQVDIMNAIHDYRSTNPGKYSQEELLKVLNEKGLNVTEDELSTLRSKVKELGIMGMGEGRGRNHMMMDK
jgi:hypothetical protein